MPAFRIASWRVSSDVDTPAAPEKIAAPETGPRQNAAWIYYSDSKSGKLWRVDRTTGEDGAERYVFASAEDLLFHTPQFYLTAMKRLHQQLDAMMRFATDAAQQRNLYVEEAEKNITYAKKLADRRDVSSLRRRPPPGSNGARRARAS